MFQVDVNHAKYPAADLIRHTHNVSKEALSAFACFIKILYVTKPDPPTRLVLYSYC